jgi:site-specific DNA-methyltransferase (adenine-specific)
MHPNTLYFGDNRDVLREHFPDESVDLVYLDPPFNSQRDYNMVYRDIAGASDTAQEQAFSDTWTMEGANEDFEAVTASGTPEGKLIDTLHEAFGDTSLVAYLSVMALRLRMLHRVLKPTGSLYLHCDPNASHYLKMVLDAIFGTAHFRSEIVWKRTFSHGGSRRYGPLHDTIFFLTKSDEYVWQDVRVAQDPSYLERHFRHADPDGRRFQPISLTGAGVRRGESGQPWRGVNPTAVSRHWALPRQVVQEIGAEGLPTPAALDALDAAGKLYWPKKADGVPRLKQYADELGGVHLQDIWTDIAPISAQATERLGYPTQKPLALLERIINASSNEGELVLDPFCGCGTAVVAAQQLGRQWCGIDITPLAVTLIRGRLSDAYPEVFPTPGSVPVIGLPRDVAGARLLAAEDKYAFQFWALTLVGAHPPGGVRRKGADRGVDGEILWRDGLGKLRKAVVSVKGGHSVSVTMLKDLDATLRAEGAEIGLFVSLANPTSPMRLLAAQAGDYAMAGTTATFPRLQLLTIEELLAGQEPKLPLASRLSATKSAQPVADDGGQGSLFDEA